MLKSLSSAEVPGVPLLSVGYARPDMMDIGTTTPSSTPKCAKFVNPTAPWSDGVMMFLIENRALWPLAVTAGFVKSRTLAPHVVTRPNEKSSRPNTWDELRVM